MIPNVHTILEPLIELPCWHVRWDRMTNLAMNFGQPSLVIREPHVSASPSPRVNELFSYRRVTVRGAWFLWVLHAYWKLTLRDRRTTTGSCSYRQMQQVLTRLDGQRLAGLEIQPATGRTTMTFDLGARLDIRRFQRSTDDVWTMYVPDSHVLTIRSDGQISHQLDTQAHPELGPWFALPSRAVIGGETM